MRHGGPGLSHKGTVVRRKLRRLLFRSVRRNLCNRRKVMWRARVSGSTLPPRMKNRADNRRWSCSESLSAGERVVCLLPAYPRKTETERLGNFYYIVKLAQTGQGRWWRRAIGADGGTGRSGPERGNSQHVIVFDRIYGVRQEFDRPAAGQTAGAEIRRYGHRDRAALRCERAAVLCRPGRRGVPPFGTRIAPGTHFS